MHMVFVMVQKIQKKLYMVHLLWHLKKMLIGEQKIHSKKPNKLKNMLIKWNQEKPLKNKYHYYILFLIPVLKHE